MQLHRCVLCAFGAVYGLKLSNLVSQRFVESKGSATSFSQLISGHVGGLFIGRHQAVWLFIFFVPRHF